MKLIFLVLSFFVFELNAADIICANGYKVRAHYRRAYFRSDGTAVKAAHVTAFCKTATKGSIYASLPIKVTSN